RARALVSSDTLDRVPQQAAFVEMFPAYKLWAEGNGEQAAAEADRLWREIESQPLGRRDGGLQSIGRFFLTVGRLRAAEAVYERVANPRIRFRGLALVSYYRGDRARLADHLKAATAKPEEVPRWAMTGTPPHDPVIGILLARAGMYSSVEEIL